MNDLSIKTIENIFFQQIRNLTLNKENLKQGFTQAIQMEKDFYTHEAVSESLYNDQISALEEGFMAGYLSAFGGD